MKNTLFYLFLVTALLLYAACGGKKESVNPVNSSGGITANAGDNKSGLVGEQIDLDGSKSSDDGGRALTYSWSFDGKPDGSTANLLNASSAKPGFVPDKVGMYTVRLTVSNGSGNAIAKVSVTAGAPPFISDFLNQANVTYTQDVGSNSPGDAGYQFSTSKDIKITHLGVLMPEPGKYTVTIWNPQSQGVVYQGIVEQKTKGTLATAQVIPNPVEIGAGKKFIVSVYYGGNPIFAATRSNSNNVMPFTTGLVTMEGACYSLGTQTKPAFPANGFQVLSKLRGFATFAYLGK